MLSILAFKPGDICAEDSSVAIKILFKEHENLEEIQLKVWFSEIFLRCFS